MLYWLVTLKGEPRRVKNKITEYELLLIAHNGNASDRYVALNSLSNWHRILNIVKNGKCNVFSKILNRNLTKSEKCLLYNNLFLVVE